MLLATWYKEALKESLLGKAYADQNKIKGVDIEDKESKEKIYQQYLEAFKEGVFDYIREDYDPNMDEVIPRQYFSGGARNIHAEMMERNNTNGQLARLPGTFVEGQRDAPIVVGNFTLEDFGPSADAIEVASLRQEADEIVPMGLEVDTETGPTLEQETEAVLQEAEAILAEASAVGQGINDNAKVDFADNGIRDIFTVFDLTEDEVSALLLTKPEDMNLERFLTSIVRGSEANIRPFINRRLFSTTPLVDMLIHWQRMDVPQMIEIVVALGSEEWVVHEELQRNPNFLRDTTDFDNVTFRMVDTSLSTQPPTTQPVVPQVKIADGFVRNLFADSGLALEQIDNEIEPTENMSVLGLLGQIVNLADERREQLFDLLIVDQLPESIQRENQREIDIIIQYEGQDQEIYLSDHLQKGEGPGLVQLARLPLGENTTVTFQKRSDWRPIYSSDGKPTGGGRITITQEMLGDTAQITMDRGAERTLGMLGLGEDELMRARTHERDANLHTIVERIVETQLSEYAQGEIRRVLYREQTDFDNANDKDIEMFIQKPDGRIIVVTMELLDGKRMFDIEVNHDDVLIFRHVRRGEAWADLSVLNRSIDEGGGGWNALQTASSHSPSEQPLGLESALSQDETQRRESSPDAMPETIESGQASTGEMRTAAIIEMDQGTQIILERLFNKKSILRTFLEDNQDSNLGSLLKNMASIPDQDRDMRPQFARAFKNFVLREQERNDPNKGVEIFIRRGDGSISSVTWMLSEGNNLSDIELGSQDTFIFKYIPDHHDPSVRSQIFTEMIGFDPNSSEPIPAIQTNDVTEMESFFNQYVVQANLSSERRQEAIRIFRENNVVRWQAARARGWTGMLLRDRLGKGRRLKLSLC